MVGRTRRVRLLAVAVCVVLTYFLYQRNAAQVDQYRDYITEGVIGGGAVLRQPEKTQEVRTSQTQASTSINAALATSSRAYAKGKAPLDAPEPTTAAHPLKTSRPASPAAQATPGQPQLQPESPQHALPSSGIDAGVELGLPIPPQPPTIAAIHWSKQPEVNPISSTIQLPTGSPKPIPRIQKNTQGSADAERLAVIKDAARHAWSGYRNHGWGYDEVQPVSGQGKNTFNGWGATLVDSLDSLWIMGMTEEFEEGVEKVMEIDFTTSPRGDIPLFEVTIRYLGGLIAAYDISDRKHKGLLDKAVELAEILYSAFDTPNRMPQTYYLWKSKYTLNNQRASNRVVMAELGTLSMEFTRLAQLTGEPKYYDAVARITDEFEAWQNITRIPGMWPTTMDASGCKKPAKNAMTQTTTELSVPGVDGPVSRGEPVQGGRASNATLGDLPTKPDEVQAAVRSGFGSAKVEPMRDTTKNKRHLYLPSGKDMLAEAEAEAKKLGESKASDKTEEKKMEVDNASSKAQTTSPRQDLLTSKDGCVPQGFGSASVNGPETFTLGGASDSTYEYLPKEYILLGGRVEQYKDMYLASMKPIVELLLFRPMTPDNFDILISGELHVTKDFITREIGTRLDPKQEHLTCFVGGMFAMGGKIFNLPEHVELGRKVTEGCIWSYNSTGSGIMPEMFTASACDSVKECTWNETKYYAELDPYEETRTMYIPPHDVVQQVPASLGEVAANAPAGLAPDMMASGEALAAQAEIAHLNKRDLDGSGSTFADLDRIQGQDIPVLPVAGRPLAPPSIPQTPAVRATPAAPAAPVPHTIQSIPKYTPKPPLPHKEYVQKKIADERLPPGFTSIGGRRYILRPEAIESVFYMYRITGEQYWRDAGWKMFQAVQKATRAEFGNSMIDDITRAEPIHMDAMESFWLAETLKYFYLLFDDPARWSLDDWVLNTEAHFFKRPANPAAAVM